MNRTEKQADQTSKLSINEYLSRSTKLKNKKAKMKDKGIKTHYKCIFTDSDLSSSPKNDKQIVEENTN